MYKNYKKYYIVHFNNFGYYSEKQSKYEWSFNEKYLFALKYKTLKGAIDRIEHALQLNGRYGKIDDFTIDILEEITIYNGTSKNIECKIKNTLVKNDILFYLKDFKEKKLSKKYPKIEFEPIKKNILNIPSDDSYWD